MSVDLILKVGGRRHYKAACDGVALLTRGLDSELTVLLSSGLKARLFRAALLECALEASVEFELCNSRITADANFHSLPEGNAAGAFEATLLNVVARRPRSKAS